jgi:hypothetical protein
MISNNENEIANTLILDLLSICNFLSSDQIPINKNIKLCIDFFKKEKREQFALLIDDSTILEIEIPEFYRENEMIRELINEIDSDLFWEFIDSEYMSGDGNRKKEICHFVYKLKKIKIACVKCDMFIKEKHN